MRIVIFENDSYYDNENEIIVSLRFLPVNRRGIREFPDIHWYFW